MNQFKGNIHSIETLGAFDGPGIRYVVFFQGCPFKCQYCHNRDTWSTMNNQLMTVEDILNDYKKYEKFYDKGGITASGGDPILQIEFLTQLFKEAKARGVHTCLDTAASCYSVNQLDKFRELLSYTDLVLLDIKHIDQKQHKKITGSSNSQVLDFARLLDELEVDTIIRHVLVPGLTDNELHLKGLRNFLDILHHVISIEVLPYHSKGRTKWEKLKLEYPLKDTKEAKDEDVQKAESILKEGYHFFKG